MDTLFAGFGSNVAALTDAVLVTSTLQEVVKFSANALHLLLQENQHSAIDARILAAAYAGVGDKDQTLA